MPGQRTLLASVSAVATIVVGSLAADPIVNCQVSDYRSGAEFNLINLPNSKIENEGYDYTIYPCGKEAVYEEKPCPFPFACQHGDGMKTHSLGSEVFRDQLQPLVNADGSMPLGSKLVMLNGSKCESGGMSRSLEIHYYCSPLEEMRVEFNEDFHCSYVMYVYTKHACPVLPAPAVPSVNPCTIMIGEQLVDLSPLKKLQGNHVIFSRDVIDKPKPAEQNEYEYIINVCQDVNTNVEIAHESARKNCHADNANPGICQVYYENTSPYKPHYRMIGQTVDEQKLPVPLQYESKTKKLFLEYPLGTAYNHKPLNGKARSAKIEFHCLENSGVGRPEFVREDDKVDGVYYFTWTTQYACPVSAASSPSQSMSGGAIFALIMFVVVPSVLLLYCVVGMIWNKKNGKSGLDMVPHIEMLRSICVCLPGSLKPPSNGLSIQADNEVQSQSLMDDDYE